MKLSDLRPAAGATHARKRLGKGRATGQGGTAGKGPGEFDRPGAVAVDSAANAYVADTANNRIVKLSPTGSVLATWGSLGSQDGRFRSPSHQA